MRIVLLQNVQDDSGDVSDANITNESRSRAASKSGGARIAIASAAGKVLA